MIIISKIIIIMIIIKTYIYNVLGSTNELLKIDISRLKKNYLPTKTVSNIYKI
ncbi:hypothetical protein V1478_007446 [Vespula squamosa]|uniref:Uncharacterized protein n=1 Tax=Vespula squamosa TaxID=30214 RepID=A0ABD2B348_VESSQ